MLTLAFWLLACALGACIAWMLSRMGSIGSRAEEAEAEAALAKALRPCIDRQHGVENMTRDELLELAGGDH